jgi:tetratricopeptide (TPR) repeat protein
VGRLRRVAILSLAVLAWAAAAPAPAAPPTADQIARWVRDLGAEDFASRQQAADALWRAGQAAEPALESALQSKDPEIARRAREILDKFRTGVYPDTPPRVVELIRRYQASERERRHFLIREFCRQGKWGLVAVRRLAGREGDAERRKNLLEEIARESGLAAGAMLADGDVAAAEQVLEATLDPAQPATLRSYAAFHLLRDTAGDKARQLRLRVEASGDKKTAAALAYLYRANGDLKAARWAAERSGDADLLEGVVGEQGDWKGLLDLLATKPGRAPNQETRGPVGLKATYLRLAGNATAADAELRQIAERSGWEAAMPLFLNDRPEEALAALERERQWGAAVAFLNLRLRQREALDLLARARPANHVEKFDVVLARARTLASLGEMDKARQELAGLTGDLRNDSKDWSPYYGMLLKKEMNLGFRDLAYEHAARILTGPQPERHSGWVFQGLFGDNADVAILWWGFLRQRSPQADVPATLKRLRGLFEDHKPGPDFETLVAAEAEVLAREAHERDQSAGSDWYARDLTTLATVCLAANRESLALTYLEKAAALPGDAAALRRLADFLADRGRWVQAADRYDQAWERDRSKALPVYLRGWALSRAGRAREGQALMDRAHLLALAEEDVRYELAEALSRHGLREAARREQEVLLRTSEFRSVYRINVLAGLVPEAVRQRDYSRAADYYQRVLLGVLESGATFVDYEACLTVPHAVHFNRARALVVTRRFDEARKEIDACLALLPGDTELPLALVPELTKRGRKAEADNLYARVVAAHEKVCADYSRCASSHNEVAWLAARCRRDLEKALVHSRRAMELEPRQAGYLDTLAEVHFQRGDRERAIELMKKGVELEPKKDYYRQQLRRFEAGDPAAEVPEG